MSSIDPALTSLTSEQLVAAATLRPRVFIEAAPGSGKTSVAVQRFGVARFTRPESNKRARLGVVAVSFTRAATWELRRRVIECWGPSALASPHRVVTIDTIINDLLGYLLRTGRLVWPNRHVALTVIDRWSSRSKSVWTNMVAKLTLDISSGVISTGVEYHQDRGNHVSIKDFSDGIKSGICTHDDVRQVLALALSAPDIKLMLIGRLSNTMRDLIVDEVFDGNRLDLLLVEMACHAGINVSIIGDPWQALYEFRDAKPDMVPEIVARNSFTRLPLNTSFRWRSREQAALAVALRASSSVTLPEASVDSKLDVALACTWKQLWDAGGQILPLAFRGFKGGTPEAAVTLLLNHVTRAFFGENAAFLNDAFKVLGGGEGLKMRGLDPLLQGVADVLRAEGDTVESAWDALKDAVSRETGCSFPRRHPSQLDPLRMLRVRLRRRSGGLVVGMTIHQAKGREWGAVGVCLSESETHLLFTGLRGEVSETHRKLYVACTRARMKTLAVKVCDEPMIRTPKKERSPRAKKF